MPRFPVQRRVLETPALAGKPFVLVRESKGQRQVVFASTAALKVGVRTGMSFAAARALEPGLPQFLYAPEVEARALTTLGEALLVLGPLFELSPPEGLFLAASAAPLFGGETGLAERALHLCQQLGFKARAAVGSEKFTVRALARYGEKRAVVVAQGQGASALASLPLTALEGPGAAVRGPLQALGLKTLGEVVRLPSAAIVARLGVTGLKAQRMARGEDEARLVPTVLEAGVEEHFNIEWPAETLEPVLFAMKSVLDRVAARLQGRQQAAVRLSLRLHLASGSDTVVPLTLARPSSQGKLLLELTRHHLSETRLDNAVTGVSVRVEESCEDRGQQLSLGDSPDGDAALEVVISRLSTALGPAALFSAQVREAHRPEQGYSAGHFSPPVRERGLVAEAQAWGTAGGVAALPYAQLERPVRMLPTATLLEVDLGPGGRLLGARILGRRRTVVAIAGPERLGGEWWATAYSRDYYRVHFEGVGPVWVYRDGQDGRFYLQGLFD